MAIYQQGELNTTALRRARFIRADCGGRRTWCLTVCRRTSSAWSARRLGGPVNQPVRYWDYGRLRGKFWSHYGASI